MKFFVVFACALAAASAGFVTPVVYGVHHLQVVGAQHLPLIGADGVPVDTAEVQQARAEHSLHKLNAQVRNGDLVHQIVAAPVYAAHYAIPAVVSHDGLPLDTAEVAAAKIKHFAAHAEALARNAHAVHYRKRRGIYAYAQSLWGSVKQHIPLIGATGVPVETPEVQHAKAVHLAAHAEAKHSAAVAPIVVSHHVPVIANGVPVETPEVQHAKAAHFAAHAEAKALNAYSAPVVAHSLVSHEVPAIVNGVPVDTLEVQHVKAAHYAAKAEAHARNGDYVHEIVVAPVAHHVPAIVNGVPVDTVEVQHAKAAHFAAKAQALNGHYAHGIVGYSGVVSPVAYHVPVIANGVPVETPEVQHAKAAHFAAHAKAAAHAYYY